MKKITPSGTRTFCTSSPLGRIDELITSPIGSGSCGHLVQRRGDRRDPLGVSRSRSTWASVSPKPGAASMSSRLASARAADRSPAARRALEPLLFLGPGHPGQLGRRPPLPAGPRRGSIRADRCSMLHHLYSVEHLHRYP